MLLVRPTSVHWNLLFFFFAGSHSFPVSTPSPVILANTQIQRRSQVDVDREGARLGRGDNAEGWAEGREKETIPGDWSNRCLPHIDPSHPCFVRGRGTASSCPHRPLAPQLTASTSLSLSLTFAEARPCMSCALEFGRRVRACILYRLLCQRPSHMNRSPDICPPSGSAADAPASRCPQIYFCNTHPEETLVPSILSEIPSNVILDAKALCERIDTGTS